MQFELIQIISMLALYGVAILTAVVLGSVLSVSSPEDTQRNKTLDGLRALAAVAVAASHINQHVCAYVGTTGVPHIGNHVGIIGVQMFFALTGYLFTERALKGKIRPVSFLTGRIRRIIPLYAFAVIVALVLGVLYTLQVQAPCAQTAKEAFKVSTYGFWNHHTLNFKGFNMLRLICVAWTLSYEWAFYLLLIPASMIWKKSRLAMGAVLAIILGLIIHQYSVQSEHVIWPFFLPGILGAVLKFYLPSPGAGVRKALTVSSAALFVLMVTLPNYWTTAKLALATCLFLSILYSEARLFDWKPLQTLATISFSIYLLQYLLLGPTSLYINTHKDMFASSPLKVAIMMSVMVALICLSFLTYLSIERPFMMRRRDTNVPQRPQTGNRPVEEFASSVR